jgi:hypothetical protein
MGVKSKEKIRTGSLLVQTEIAGFPFGVPKIMYARREQVIALCT